MCPLKLTCSDSANIFVCLCVYSSLCSRVSLVVQRVTVFKAFVQSVRRRHKTGRPLCRQPCRTSHPRPPFTALEGFLRRLTVEAFPPQALRRFPPVSAMASTDGAVVHLHFNASWDDRRSSEAIWTCHVGETNEEILREGETRELSGASFGDAGVTRGSREF